MSKINVLPNWMLPDSIPSVYDVQSGSFQEMVAKVYGAMRTLQLDYNSFVNEINNSINNFVESTNKDQEDFKEEITKIMHEYIQLIDDKVKMQDLKIEEDITYIKNNIFETAQNIINEAIANGDLSLSSNYENETIYLTITDNGGVE